LSAKSKKTSRIKLKVEEKISELELKIEEFEASFAKKILRRSLENYNKIKEEWI
jgi:ATP-binding cassette subfamily F protein 3